MVLLVSGVLGSLGERGCGVEKWVDTYLGWVGLASC